MPTLTPHDFVSKWKRVTAREKQTYQEHFLDLCTLVGHQTPNDLDPTGTHFGFEMGAAKTSGGQGWADVAKFGFFGWEYKAKHAKAKHAQCNKSTITLHCYSRRGDPGEAAGVEFGESKQMITDLSAFGKIKVLNRTLSV